MFELQQLLSALDRQGVRYLLCGGLAVNIYGVSRSTADIDILLDFTEENVDKFLKLIFLLKYLNSIPLPFQNLIDAEARKKAVKEKNLIAYSFFSTLKGRMSLDVLIDVPVTFDDLWERRETRLYEGVPVQMVSVDDLIILKEYAGREQDLQDVILLSRLKNS